MLELFLMAVLFFQQQPAAAPSGTISGRLLEFDRTPAVRRLVSVRPAASNQGVFSYPQSFTDQSGAFHFEGVSPGSYYVIGNSLYYPGVADRDEARVITITAENPAIGGLEFVLPAPPPGVRVSGRVIAPENATLPEDQKIVGLTGGRSYRSFTTAIAADGTFEFRNVAAGSYSLSASKVMDDVELTVGDRDVTGVEVRIPRLVAVLGTVAVEGRAARPTLSVGFDGPMPQFLSQTRTRPDGTFEVRLVEGEYRVDLDNLPAGYYVKSFTAGSLNLLTEPLKVDGASPSARLVATLATSPGVKLSGHVKASADGLPELASRRITLVAAASHRSVSALLNDDGSFAFDKVMPGTYAARVSLDTSLSSAPVTVVLSDKDTKDLDIMLPALVEVFGRVAVDGRGPAPRFSLLLLRGTGFHFKSENKDELPSIAPSALDGLADSGNAQVIRIEVEPLADGTFKMRLPEGVYRMAADEVNPFSQRGIRDPFFLRYLNYGSARLLTEPMVVSAAERADIQIGFGTKIPDPWVKVTGHVTGLSSSQGSFRVALDGDLLAPIEVPVNSDGTFEFPMVLAGEEYTASLVPSNPAAHTARVRVGTKDVKDVTIVVPSEREITVRAAVEGGGPVPGFLLKLESGPCNPFCAGTMSVVVKPDRDGMFKAKLPEDERSIYVDGLPIGYSVQSITYGSTVLKQGEERSARVLKLGGSESRELEVKLAPDPDIPTGSVRGRVTGLDPEIRSLQLVLHGVSFLASFEAPVNADGSFSFSKLPQGTYTPTLTGDVVSGALDPSSIAVTGKDLIGIQLAAPRRNARSERSPVEPAPTGAQLSELGRASNVGANESAAVANLRTINTAEVTYLAVSMGNYGTLQNLIDAGLLDDSFLGLKAGYHFSIVATGSEYNATAVPAPGGGRLAIYSTPDAVVRYSLGPILAPQGQGGQPLR